MSAGFVRKSSASIAAYAIRLEAEERLTPVVAEAIDKATNVRDNHDLVYYIAGALTGMSENVKLRYVDVSNRLNRSDVVDRFPSYFAYAPHVNGTDPVKHPDVSPDEVRDIDYLWAVHTADRHINFWTPTAHGNSIEAGWAEEHDIPSIYVVEGAQQQLSRLVRGMRNIQHTIEYADWYGENDGLRQVLHYIYETHEAMAENLQR